jgi:Putative Actinobacterial Holin-X, holin superfamily III
MTPDGTGGNGSGQPQNIATAITDVSERISVLVREEIELAKTEVSEKVTKLIKGAIVAMAAGIFVVTALLFALHGLSWFAWDMLAHGGQVWLGYFIVAGGLLLLGALAGWIAARALRSGSPPTPAMAIDEARKIRETVSASEPGSAH